MIPTRWITGSAGRHPARAQMFRGYARADIPRTFAGWDDYAETMEAIVAVCGLAALVHGLVPAAGHEPARGAPVPREALVESSFRAGRDGLDATVWNDGAVRPVRERIASALAHAEGGMARVLRRLIDGSAEPMGAPASVA